MRTPVLTVFRTNDPVIDKNLDHVVQTLNPVLRNPLLSAADFRWTEVAATSATGSPTFALQYRTQQKWATVLTVDATGALVQPAWVAPALLNSWVNFDAVNNSIAGYMKDSQGFVHLRGTVKSGTVGLGTPIFTLPSGYRPSKGVNFPVVSNALFGYVFVDTAGGVQVIVGSNVYVDLDDISFDTRS